MPTDDMPRGHGDSHPPSEHESIPVLEVADEAEILTVLPAGPVAEAPPHPGVRWALLWCFGIYLVQTFAVLLGIVLYIVGVILTHDRSFAEMLEQAQRGERELLDYLLTPQGKEMLANLLLPIFACVQVMFVVYAWAATRLVVGKEWARVVALRRSSYAHLLLALLCLPGLTLLAVAIDTLVKDLLPPLVDMEQFADVLGAWPLLVGILLIGVGAGVAEELFFRGFLGRGIVGRHGVWWGVFWTSLLFGLIHLEPRQVCYATVMGVFLHSIYLMTRSLWLPILLHTLNNSLAVAATRSPTLAALEEATQAHWWLLFLGAEMLLAVGLWAMYRSRVRLVLREGPDLLPWHLPYPGVEHPPPNSTYRLEYPPVGWAASAVVLLAVAVFIAAAAGWWLLSFGGWTT
ncbi:MAG: lysostaphin resistance A-like protein [Gemmataceae bacterium]